MLSNGRQSKPADGNVKDRNVVNYFNQRCFKGFGIKVVFMVKSGRPTVPIKGKGVKKFPSRKESKENVSPDQDFHLEEEEDFFMSGMTRAKRKDWYFTASDYTQRPKTPQKIVTIMNPSRNCKTRKDRK